jgi:hypothetical protein
MLTFAISVSSATIAAASDFATSGLRRELGEQVRHVALVRTAQHLR